MLYNGIQFEIFGYFILAVTRNHGTAGNFGRVEFKAKKVLTRVYRAKAMGQGPVVLQRLSGAKFGGPGPESPCGASIQATGCPLAHHYP